MKLDNIISVTGLPGLYTLMASRSNGILIEALDSGKRQFVSARKHQFTPLISIGIYTYMDTVGLDEVFKKIDALSATEPAPDLNQSSEKLRSWFKTILPEHDEDRVHINDIKKVIKWRTFLKAHGPQDDEISTALQEEE